MGKKVGVFLLMLAGLAACNNANQHSEYHALNNGVWASSDTLTFQFSGLTNNDNHSLFFNVRNDNDYPFSNLFLIAEMHHPNGEILIDTLEYTMAEPDGTWLGKGHGSLKESKLWFKENIKLLDSSVYLVKVTHAMRENGQVQGITNLKGITDFGIEIQTTP